MRNLSKDSCTSEKDQFLYGLKCKSLRALKNKRARLVERTAFAGTMATRDQNLELLQAVDEEIASRR